jgi:hypothetical protein
MDLLRFLLMLPVRLVRGVLSALGWILAPLVGNVTWAAPTWMHVVGRPLAFGFGCSRRGASCCGRLVRMAVV